MTKTGILEVGEGEEGVNWAVMMCTRSDIMRDVGPVRPFWEGVWIERPHPLWSKEKTSMDLDARWEKSSL